MKYSSVLICLLLFTVSCEKDDTPGTEASTDILGVSSTISPISLVDASVSFYQDISYGSDARNVFDFYAPDSESPTALAIYIHGGGFVVGDKGGSYNDANFGSFVDALLTQNIAFASINYRLLGLGETEGVLKSLGDSKRALQYIRLHASDLNIDKEEVILIGGSA